jgi:alginate O-acetyltransferase complex protein AlgJ
MLTLHAPRFAALGLAGFAMLMPGAIGLLQRTAPDLSYENRKPTSWPTHASLSARVQGYQDFFADRLGGRSQFVMLRNRIYYWLGLSPNPLARNGRDGWLLTTAGSALLDRAGLRPFDDRTVREFQSQIAARVDFWRRRKIAYYLMLGPEKTSIYPERLDPLFPVGETAFDHTYRIYGRDVFGPRFVDPRYALRNDKRRLTYFESDSHWNLFGARIAYRELIDAVAREFPAVTPVPNESYGVVWKPHRGDLVPHGLEALYAEEEPYVVADALGCGTQTKLTRPDWPDLARDFESSLARCPGRKLTVLVVHDSYGRALRPLLARTFATTVFASMPAEGDIPGELVDAAEKIAGPIDIIVQVRVERAFLQGKME